MAVVVNVVLCARHWIVGLVPARGHRACHACIHRYNQGYICTSMRTRLRGQGEEVGVRGPMQRALFNAGASVINHVSKQAHEMNE